MEVDSPEQPVQLAQRLDFYHSCQDVEISSRTTASVREPTEMPATLRDLKDWNEIGLGSFSTVYRATLPGADGAATVAIKAISQALIMKEKKVENVMREKDVMITLKETPLMVHLHATFKDNTKLYFVMTYCCNGDLQRYTWRYGVLDQPVAQFYGAEIILALEYLRTHNVIHRWELHDCQLLITR